MKDKDFIKLLADFLEEKPEDIEEYYHSQQPPKFDSGVMELSNEFMSEPQYTVVWTNNNRMPKDVTTSELMGFMYKKQTNA